MKLIQQQTVYDASQNKKKSKCFAMYAGVSRATEVVYWNTDQLK